MSKKAAVPDNPPDRIVVFQEKAIRRTWHNAEWWFSVIDVCGVLTASPDAGAYWRKLKQRLGAEGSEVVTFCHGLKLEAPDGKQRTTDCANTEGLFRIIQSIPSPRAEPFKRWLAQVGYERVKKIENPELASARARELYQAKGYPQAWIEKRLRSIAVRGELTDEWKARGVEEGTGKKIGLRATKYVFSDHDPTNSPYLDAERKYLLRDHTIRHYHYGDVNGMALADLENTNIEVIR